MKTIGIKLADGSFFPVMEEGSNQSKQLELTTANNNQTCVMVDLYRSETGTMDDAEYIDTLKIENLNEHPNGEPNLAFSIQLDENNQLTANIEDPETGATSDSSIPLVTRTEEELATTDDYTISEAPALEADDETLSLDAEPVTADEPLPDMDLDLGGLDDLGDLNLDEPAAPEEPAPDADETIIAEEPSFTEEPDADETIAMEEEPAASTEEPLPDMDLDLGGLDDLGDLNLDEPAATEEPAPDADETIAMEEEPADSTEDAFADTDFNFDEPAAATEEPEAPADESFAFDNEPVAKESLAFEEPVAKNEEGAISFKGLYDKETEMGDSGFHEEKTTKKSRLYVWICLICALICIIATVLILILAPLKMKKTPAEPDQIALSDLKETAEASEKKETPKAPSAKDNEIVVIKQAETVEPSPVAKTNCSNVKYKLKWGDTLWDIANTYYKNPWKYHKIAKYNNIKNPDHIISGTVIVIPAE